MRIYIAGPYTASTPQQIGKNVKRADEIARELLYRGYDPFCPHKMTQGWENDDRLTMNDFLMMDTAYLLDCDALLFLGRSPGANKEREIAERVGMPVFENIDDIPISGGDGLSVEEVAMQFPRLWYPFRSTQRDDSFLFAERSMYYGEEWRRFGPEGLVFHLARKMNVVDRWIDKGPSAFAAELDTEQRLGYKDRLHEALRDMRVYATMLEAALREEEK